MKLNKIFDLTSDASVGFCIGYWAATFICVAIYFVCKYLK